MGVLGIVGSAAQNNAAGGLGRYDVKRKNNWVLHFSNFGSDVLKNSLTIQLSKAVRPNFQTTAQELFWCNESWFVASKPTYNELSISFYDALPTQQNYAYQNPQGPQSPHPDGNASMVSSGQIMYDWWLAIYDPSSGRIGLASDYKADGFITMYSSVDVPIERWMYIGAFPTAIDYGSLDYADAGAAMTIEVTMKYDKAMRLADPTSELEPTSIDEQRGPESYSGLGLNLVSGAG